MPAEVYFVQVKFGQHESWKFALIVGDSEIETETVGVKYLREDKEQQTIALNQLVDYLKKNVTIQRHPGI